MKQEEINKLRNDFVYLSGGDTLIANFDMCQILCECMFQILNIHGREIPQTKAESESKLVLQMMFSKLLSLRDMLAGVNFESRDGSRINTIIDPTVVAVLVRTLYETVAMFNLVFIIPQFEEERKIMYNLWVIAGLKYRQKFSNNITIDENRQKQIAEAAEILTLTSEIEKTNVFNSLTDAGKKKIIEQIKKRDYKVKINRNDVELLSWETTIPHMNMDVEKMGPMYNYFSLYAHPSNVAVFQYVNLFDKQKNDYIQMSNFNIATGIKLISFFIANYIQLFPKVKEIFENLPLIDQIMINYHSKFITKDGRTINDTLTSLG
ncbi:DUF5677 domain-containing protein [Mucilaginibacter myungsuensis]|uniref:Uncharacterized protein n=1 Tax=Mucilaginibacter myungsuensis TaxID=649104 RepID=A0A929PVP5_9SPHI|nr:DUF5677 domain-containing protein [Mucilaginibacter myungsuensis]MBE9660530.1 hypothetical protein [Mucilaginibacter myungsuensis]MDN3600575.1 hypothetical protein [Mucilaginibacter myungsuensis]